MPRPQTPSAGVILDDIDARPGSTASLLRTFIGLYLRRLDGWISASDLVRFAGLLGIPPAQARTGITRLKQKDLLLAAREEGIGYRLNPAAIPMLERGDRRIFDVRRMALGDPWCLLSFSIPETRRDLRHRLRSRLQWIGCGMVSPALWICPGYLQDEVEEILAELDAREWATMFRTQTPQVAGSLAAAVADWWDLSALRAEHELFQESIIALPDAASEPFAAYVRFIDAWRVLPYRDPGLPAELLPADWPGQQSFEAHARLSAQLAGPAWDLVRATAGVRAP